MTKDELYNRATPVFESHPEAKILYGTTDGELFFDEAQAALHAAQLGLMSVETINRKAEKPSNNKPSEPQIN